MQTIIRTNPHTGQTRAYREYTPQEIDAIRLEQHMQLILTKRIGRALVGTVRMDEFIPDTGRKTLPRKSY